MKATVKIMRSYDYNHFEVSLSSDEEMNLEQIDDMRKEAARLVDKAVTQYQVAKVVGNEKIKAARLSDTDIAVMKRQYERAVKVPEQERSPSDKAEIKAYEDHKFMLEHVWDYQDWWYDDYFGGDI